MPRRSGISILFGFYVKLHFLVDSSLFERIVYCSGLIHVLDEYFQSKKKSFVAYILFIYHLEGLPRSNRKPVDM